MKNTVITIIVILVPALICFQWGYRIGSGKSMPVATSKEVDSLKKALIESERVKQIYIQAIARDYLHIEKLEGQIKKLDTIQQNNRVYYGNKIKAVEKYSPGQLDTFFINRYPGARHIKDTCMACPTDSGRFSPRGFFEIGKRSAEPKVYTSSGSKSASLGHNRKAEDGSD